MLGKFFLLLCIFGLCLFWWRSRAAAERAERIVRIRCRDVQVQFLDGTVSLSKIWLGKNLKGGLQWCRQFRFDFSANGADRYTGYIELFGEEVERIELPPYRDQP